MYLANQIVSLLLSQILPLLLDLTVPSRIPVMDKIPSSSSSLDSVVRPATAVDDSFRRGMVIEFIG